MQEQSIFDKFDSDIEIVEFVKSELEKVLVQYYKDKQYDYFFETLKEIQFCNENIRTLKSIKQIAENITQGDTGDHGH